MRPTTDPFNPKRKTKEPPRRRRDLGRHVRLVGQFGLEAFREVE